MWHTAGAVLSASVLGLVLGSFGLLLQVERWGPPIGLASAIIFLLCALRDIDRVRWPFLSLRRQTPAWCLCAFGPRWGALAWGIDLGQGWTTLSAVAGYSGLILWTVLNANPGVGSLILGCYGLGRALPVLVAGLFARQEDLVLLATCYVRRLPLIQQLNAVAFAFAAGYALLW